MVCMYRSEKKDDRTLFKLGALCLICHYFASQNKYFCEIKIFFPTNQFQITFTENKICSLCKKFPLFI